MTRPTDRTTVMMTGMAALSAFGRGTAALVAAALSGTPAFAPVTRFDVTGRRVGVAATMPGTPDLRTEIIEAVTRACDEASLRSSMDSDTASGPRADTGLLLAVHADPESCEKVRPRSAGEFAADIAHATGLGGPTRAYTSACVAAPSAVADAAAMVALGRAERVVVAAGYLVEADQFAIFDAGRALARDGQVRPFSAGRTGLLLGDGVAAIVIESAASARRRGATILARLAGWGRAGDAHHVCQPRPDGAGLARAIEAALARAGVSADQVGYVNAHGSGTPHSDPAESAALRLAFGEHTARLPVSSTKSVHGQALEASGLLELIVTVLALRQGQLPVNAGFLGPDAACALDLVTTQGRHASPSYALSLNSAFGGANTALLVGTP